MLPFSDKNKSKKNSLALRKCQPGSKVPKLKRWGKNERTKRVEEIQNIENSFTD